MAAADLNSIRATIENRLATAAEAVQISLSKGVASAASTYNAKTNAKAKAEKCATKESNNTLNN